MGRLVVGVDESQGAASALRWAVGEATRRSWSVTAILAWGWLDQHHVEPAAPFDPSYGEADARAALGSIVEAVVGSAPAVPVARQVVCDLPARALVEASEGSDLLVVGARGLGGFRGLLLGSVSQQCLQHATGPVAVVRDHGPGRHHVAKIVVGTDGSDTAHDALAWALETARIHRATVDVVHAWAFPYATSGPYGTGLVETAPLEALAWRTLQDAIGRADVRGLAAPLTHSLAIGGAANALVAAAEDADLVVVGSRGRTGLKAAILGSVSNSVASRAVCPVVVVPPAGRESAGSTASVAAGRQR